MPICSLSIKKKKKKKAYKTQGKFLFHLICKLEEKKCDGEKKKKGKLKFCYFLRALYKSLNTLSQASGHRFI